MIIFQRILKWSQDLPTWQQDTISRLYQKIDLSSQDLEDIYALLRSAHGIPDPDDRIPTKLTAAQLAAPQVSVRSVQLVAIKNLRNVNALAEDQCLPLNQNGLSVIYGENGAGKSGYSRVLKKACRARDQREPIHPNAHKDPSKAGPAQATFDLIVDGTPITLDWTLGKEPPEQLSSISIFDSHCARAYIDNHGDFAYVPYGLDILERLVNVCNTMRTRATKEIESNNPELKLFAFLSNTKTEAGKLLTSLSAKTKPEDVESLATLTDAELARLSILNKTLAEADPKQKASILKVRANRFLNLAVRIGSACNILSDINVVELKTLIEKAKIAKEAAEFAGKKFKETPGLLPGTGNEAWKALFEAARAFAATSHPGMNFPYLGAESPCPLCQEPLELNGAQRLQAFDAFYQQAAEKAEKTARKLVNEALSAIELAPVDLQIDEALATELAEALETLGDQCLDFQKALIDRHTAIINISKSDGDWDTVPALFPDPCRILEEIKTRLLDDAKILEDSMDEKARALLLSEKAELDARQKLSDQKDAVLSAIEKFVLIDKLKLCYKEADPTPISRQSTKISHFMATPEVASALNEELEKLNVHELKVVMKPESPRGKTRYKLVLEIPGSISAKDILSEGEQRAIAIASFLAEVSLAKGPEGILLDDPVSSLDHRRRWHVARRLAEEATRRQVIIFTHDIYFLCILQKEAEAIGASCLSQYIRKTPSGFGVRSEHLPFDAQSTKERVKYLRQMYDAAYSAHKSGDEDAAKRITRDAYQHLRLAWERGIEEVLFQGVVKRFDEGLSTQKLSYVVVEDSDYEKINTGMTKCSKFAHDPALNALLSIPHPNELKDDIDALEGWRKSVETRKDAIRARRSQNDHNSNPQHPVGA